LDPSSEPASSGVSQQATNARTRQRTNAQRVYAAALVAWLFTRLLVLIHQGAWPWMNAFVVAAARGIVVGEWNEAVRPQLPAVLGVPLVLLGATEQQTVAVLYLVASLVEFAAFVALVRALFPARLREQTLALLIFLVVPLNHSIHHYRDVPVVLASAAIFLLCAEFVRALSRNAERGTRNVLVIVGAMLLGIWSRAETLTFVAALVLLTLAVWRGRALHVALTYAGAAAAVTATLLLVYYLEGVDLAEASFYQAHTFLDSTPDSWLTPECRANPTENCRERDGLSYFGPADLHAGLVPMLVGHPLTTAAKSARSALDNLWTLFAINLSTFPGIVPFVLLAVALAASARSTLRAVPLAAWVAALAVAAESVLPPLTWAPPHPQYHLQLVLPIVVVVVPLLVGLFRGRPGRLAATAFLIGSALLSAFRYTRYAGY
jgi:hypothetical protein